MAAKELLYDESARRALERGVAHAPADSALRLALRAMAANAPAVSP